ncbi:MAG: gamma-glutamylcyclotransferase [Myxococcota bacterium]
MNDRLLEELEPLWIFGYGSLVWKPSIPFDESRSARIFGFIRRFYQGSVDHRGVPKFPGRVVTLLEEPDGEVWGRAYRIPGPRRGDVLDSLDHREKGGYTRYIVDIDIEPGSGRTERGLVYVAHPKNRNYAGPESIEQIAEVVRSAHGPSGPNDEYVLRLAEALRAMGAEDPHVFALEEAVLGY